MPGGSDGPPPEGEPGALRRPPALLGEQFFQVAEHGLGEVAGDGPFDQGPGEAWRAAHVPSTSSRPSAIRASARTAVRSARKPAGVVR